MDVKKNERVKVMKPSSYFNSKNGNNRSLLWRLTQIKPSNHFNSMDEIRTFVEESKTILSNEEYHILKIITGLSEQEGDFEEVSGIGEIDKTIVPIIKYLNQKLFITNSSCSGIRSEHQKWSEQNFSGYISIIDDGDENKKIKIKNIATNLQFSFDEEEVYLKPVYTIRTKGSDEYKLKAWEQLFEQLLLKIN